MFLPLWWRVDPHIWVVSFMRWKGVCYMCLLTEDVNGNLVLLFTLIYWLTVTEYMSHRRQETCSVCRNQSIHPMCRSHNSFRSSFIFHVFFIWNYFSFLDNILKEKLPWDEEYFSRPHILISSLCSTNTILVQLFNAGWKINKWPQRFTSVTNIRVFTILIPQDLRVVSLAEWSSCYLISCFLCYYLSMTVFSHLRILRLTASDYFFIVFNSTDYLTLS